MIEEHFGLDRSCEVAHDFHDGLKEDAFSIAAFAGQDQETLLGDDSGQTVANVPVQIVDLVLIFEGFPKKGVPCW